MYTYPRLHLKEVPKGAEGIYNNRTENRGCMGKDSVGKCTKEILYDDGEKKNFFQWALDI